MLFIPLVSSEVALAADEPCYGHSATNRVSTDQFWVEWDGTFLDESKATIIAEAAEHAADAYRELGWSFTTEPVVIAVTQQGSFGTSGLTRTSDCSAVPVPRIDLTIGQFDEGVVVDVTSHEVGHIAEYAYMGAYDDAVDSWLWWMESTATWLTPHADGLWTGWGDTANDYLNHPDLGLHHGLEGFLDPEISAHMYGSTYVTETLAEYAGDDAVLATWEYGGTVSGTPIFFPDAVNGAGVDFNAYWDWHLASLPTRDIERNAYVRETAIEATAGALPDDGTGAPEGLGAQVVRFPSTVGDKKSQLDVTFDGDPAVPWHVVLVRTTGEAIVDYVSLPVTDGHAEGHISGFYRVDGWLVVSPESMDLTPHTYTWSAELAKDEGPMDGLIALSEAPDPGGCDHTHTSGLLVALAALAVARRRS